MKEFFEIVGSVLMVVGAGIIFIAGLGVVRFPRTLPRAHALGAAATSGIGCLLTGVMLVLADFGATAKLVLTVFLLFLTSPVGSHMLGRVAYRLREVPLSVRKDEWRARPQDDETAEATEER